MEYRKLPHGEEQISIIGMGNSSLGASGGEEAEKTIAMERKEAMDSLSSSVVGLAMTAAAKLLAEQSGPERDGSVYDSFLKKAGEGK